MVIGAARAACRPREATRQGTVTRMRVRQIVTGLGAEPGEYVLATIHRPENDPERLRATLDELSKLGLPVLLPLRERLAAIPCPYGDGKASERIATLLQAFLR